MPVAAQLAPALRDESVDVRAAAAFALGKLGSAAQPYSEFVHERRVTSFRLFRHSDFENLNGRLPVKLGSERRETLSKGVPNNFGRCIFRPKTFFRRKFRIGFLFFADLAWIWKSYGEMDVKIILRVKFCSR